MVFAYFFAGYQLCAGIFGLSNANNLKRARASKIIGVLALIFALPHAAVMFLPEDPVLAARGVFILAAPIVYVYGVQKNIKKKKEEADIV